MFIQGLRLSERLILAPEIASYSQTGLGFCCFCVQFVPGTLGMKQSLPAELSVWYVGPISLSFPPSLLFFHSLCVCVCVCRSAFLYVCMCVCMHRCVCVCLCMHVHVCSSTLACVEAWAGAKCPPVLYVTLFLRLSLSLIQVLIYHWLASRGPRMSLTLLCPLYWHCRCVPWVLRAHACRANILSTDPLP